MMAHLLGKPGQSHSHDPSLRGYHIAYRDNEVNHCPGCGRSQWYVGRFSAECGYCSTALPRVESLRMGEGLFVSRGRSAIHRLDAAA